jgi:hypothetical protein
VEIRQLPPDCSLFWIVSGARFYRQNMGLWVVVSALYLAAALALLTAPVIGPVLLLFVGTVLFAASLTMADQLAREIKRRERRARRGRVPEHHGAEPQSRLTHLLQALGSAYTKLMQDERLIALFELCVIVVALGFVVLLVGQGIGGGLLYAPGRALEAGTVSLVRLGLAYLVMGVLGGAGLMALIYAVPLSLMDDISIGTALKASFFGVLANFHAVVMCVAALASPAILAVALSYWLDIHPLLIWIVAGPLLLPLAVNTAYCSYRLIFR